MTLAVARRFLDAKASGPAALGEVAALARWLRALGGHPLVWQLADAETDTRAKYRNRSFAIERLTEALAIDPASVLALRATPCQAGAPRHPRVNAP